MSKKKVVSDIDEHLIPDLSGIVGDYISDYDITEGECSRITEEGDRCSHQSVYTKTVDGDTKNISCKHYCREHCEKSILNLFGSSPSTAVLLSNDNIRFTLNVSDKLNVTVEAGGGKAKTNSYGDIDKVIQNDNKKLMSKYSSEASDLFCKLLQEYKYVNFEISLKSRGPSDISYESVKFVSFQDDNGKDMRWISSPPAWKIKVTRNLSGSKFINLFLKYSLSHKEENEETYSLNPLVPIVDKPDKKFIKFLNAVIKQKLISNKVVLLIDLVNHLNKRIIKINVDDAKRLRELMREIYTNPTITQYDKSRIENRYRDIFGYGIKDEKEEKNEELDDEKNEQPKEVYSSDDFFKKIDLEKKRKRDEELLSFESRYDYDPIVDDSSKDTIVKDVEDYVE